MSADLRALIDAASANITNAPLSRRQVVPYGDLNALNIPGELNQMSNSLINALAILVAQGRNSAKLLSVDDSGGLKTSSRMNAITRFGAPLPALATIATVLDTSQFYPGDHVALITNGNPNVDCVDVVVKQIDSPTQMQFVATCNAVGFQPGDWVIGEQTMNIRQIYEAVDISDRVARLLGHVNVDRLQLDNSIGVFGKTATGPQTVTAVVDNLNQVYATVRSIDDPPIGFIGLNFAPGTTPTLSIGAISGQSIDLMSWSTIMANVSGAAAHVAFVTVVTTGVGGATLWEGHLGVPNIVGSVASLPSLPTRLVGGKGQGITIAWDASAPAGYGQDINAAYTYR